MANGAGFVRVPPQSTGRRVSTEVRSQLGFDNLISSANIGDIVVGATSNAQGEITGVTVDGFPAGEGLLWLANVDGTFIDNEPLEVSSVQIAQVNITTALPFETYDYSHQVLVDPDNPRRRQRIDRFGATVNTFEDGSPIFGSFGTLSVGQPQVIKDYRFAYDSQDSQFWDQTSGTGVVSWESNGGRMLFSTGTASGDLASRTSNFYHPYAPGVGHEADMTVRHGDVGKTGNRRRWGYFDDDNGVFFELDGTDLYVVLRSNVSGSVVDTRIAQSDFNKDRLDGSGNIEFTLDITSANIYWIDLQWLGAGRIRFGITEPSGSRIVAHVIQNANMNVEFPYMRTATLPLRFENENTGVAASTSEMRWVCGTVKHSTRYLIAGDRRTANSGLGTVATGSEVPVYAIRPALTYEGRTNRVIARAMSIDLTNIANTGDGPVIFRLRLFDDPAAALTGEAFAAVSTVSAFEVDTTATAINTASSIELGSFVVVANDTHHIDNDDNREIHSWELFLGADAVSQPGIVITAECLSGTNADVLAAVNWEEYKF